MRFKQYLYEETDVTHKKVADAVKVYLESCKEWKNVETPLYRISHNDDAPTMRTRVPRDRLSPSKAGTRALQDYFFSQPGWEDFPKRPQSIFCSTTDATALGQPNLLIYPFDGVKIAVASSRDLNLGNILAPVPRNKRERNESVSFDSFERYLKEAYYGVFDTHAPKSIEETVEKIKEKFLKKGKFDEEANGDTELEELYDEARPWTREMIQIVCEYIPAIFTPKAQGFLLQTSRKINLPGKQREVWFSGKYLSIPKAYHQQFVEEVKAAQ